MIKKIQIQTKTIKRKKKKCQKWDSNPRPHSWTRTLSTVRVEDRDLESGALDHSAILTTDKRVKL